MNIALSTKRNAIPSSFGSSRHDGAMSLRTEEGYSYKRASELFKEYKEKCTEDNFLYAKLLRYLLTYFIAMSVVSQTFLQLALDGVRGNKPDLAAIPGEVPGAEQSRAGAGSRCGTGVS